MDTYDNDLNPMEDFEDGEPEERRRRRDFVGTELERPKRGSRAQNKKRKRTGLTLMDDIEPSASNSTMETDFAPPATKKKAGPLGVKGASRSFNIVLDNDVSPEEAIASISSMDKESEELADVLAKYLWEPKKHIFKSCFETFSRERMVAWLKETIEIEKTEGMVTLQGKRRKTPGGVFFTLVSRDANEEEKLKTVGLPVIKALDAPRRAPRNQGTIQGKKPKYTPLSIPAQAGNGEVSENSEVSESNGLSSVLDATKARKNPFALSTPLSAASSSASTSLTSNKASLGSVFGTSEEDLGEAV